MTTLKNAKVTFITTLSAALDHMVNEVETHDYNKEPLTLSNLTASTEFVAGVDKALLALAMSTVTENCSEWFIQRGRGGGFKKGERPESKGPKPPSEKALLKQKHEELLLKVQELEAQLQTSDVSDSDISDSEV